MACFFERFELLEWDDIAFTDGVVLVTVRPEVSKTHRGRTVPVLDGRVAQRLRERSERPRRGAKHAFGTPLVPKHEWERGNCVGAVNKYLHEEVAVECDIDKLKDHGSHIWRATLSTIAMTKDVPSEIRAAAFGHSPEVNLDSYTDVTDIATYTKSMMR